MIIPVITIDGPSGCGKGTVSQLVAQALGWHFLDSGILYRVLALAAQRRAIDLDDEQALAALAVHLELQFVSNTKIASVILEGSDVAEAIRSEACGNAASIIGTLSGVRSALLQRQRAFRKLPGLVTDGRDMGSVVFPDATLKVFLTAALEERAQRRYKQLKAKGMDVKLGPLLAELLERDRRDKARAIAPLQPAQDAIIIDTTQMTIADVVEVILAKYQEKIATR